MASSRPTSSASSRADAGNLARAFAAHRPALVHYVTQILDSDTAGAEDVVQAAHEALLASTADPTLSAVEVCFAACHRQAHTAARLVDSSGHFGEPRAGSAQESAAENAMLRHIDRLTPKQQEVLRLKFQHGFNHAAIARITDLSDDKVLGLIHTAVARLRVEFPSHAPIEDPRATASALDEHSDPERIAFAAILREDSDLRTGVAEIRAFAQQIQEAFDSEAGRQVSQETKNPAASSDRKPSRRLLVWFAWTGALAAAAGVFYYLRSAHSDRPFNKAPSADFSLRPGAWHDPVPEEEKKSRSFRSDVAAGASATPREKNSPEKRPAIERTLSSKRAATSWSETPTTGEKPSEPGAALGPPDLPAALGQSPSPSDRDAANSPEIKSAETTARDKQSPETPPRTSLTPDNSSHPFAQETSKNLADSKGHTVPLASKGPGGKGGLDVQTPRENPMSVLPSDLETTSAENLFHTLSSGALPKAGEVHIGAMLNYFPTNDVAPQAPETFSATLESAEAPWNPQHRLVRIGLKGRETPPAPRSRANLVFLIDVSGSMDLPDRLPLIQESLRLLLLRLEPDDRVAIVTYAGESQLLLPSTPVGDTQRIRHVLRALHPAGQTNGGAGIQLAYLIAKGSFVEGGANRVILCTDGDFNLGTTNAETLAALAADQAKSGISLSVFGFGRGYQVDARLEALAARGSGHSGYVNTRGEAERALAGEIDGLIAPIARDLKLNVTFNPALVSSYRLIGYDEREIPSSTAAPTSAATALVAAGQTLTALYEIVPVLRGLGEAANAESWLTFHVDYQSPSSSDRRRLEFPLTRPPTSFEHASVEFKFAAAVAAFGMILSDSPQRGSATLANVVTWAESGKGDDAGGYRSEFIDLVRAAGAIAPAAPIARTGP